jgi:aminoglycoside phosphotransferase family enzyme/predicted kinase
MAILTQGADVHEADLVTALRCPDAYPGNPSAVEVRETHISIVFLAGDRAYKLKKPLLLPFVDYSTPARRRVMCEEEVRLNRRLAPDVYLGVSSVLAGDHGEVWLGELGDPRAIDHMVVMRRFDERSTLASLVGCQGVSRSTLRSVGGRLAEFHARAQTIGAEGATAALHAALAENADTLLERAPDRSFARRVGALERFCAAFFAARREELETRAGAGLVRDGHGDLRAEHVLLERGIEIVDCVEFDPALRIVDVACDLAFLTMDLERLGAPAAARAVLDGYRAAGGNAGDDALVAFFGVYRALVRAKVTLVRASQPDGPPAAAAQADAHLALAERLAWRVRIPAPLVLAGLSATGKTRLATELAARSGLPHLNSDPVRKRLAGVAPSAHAGPSAYGKSFNRRTYLQLGRLTGEAIARDGGALVDATFRHAEDHAAFVSGFGKLPARSLFVECRTPVSVRLERVRTRAGDPAAVSDADEAVVRAQADDGRLDEEVPAAQHVTLRTDRELQEVVEDLAALLDARLARAAQ